MHNESIYFNTDNNEYLSRHPEIERFNMPKTFYFRYLPDRLQIHWAIIVPLNDTYHSPATIYFINNFGRVFDKLEFKSVKIARRRLRKCGFDFSTNKHCSKTPREPIYIQLSEGKKSAPYSKGNLFQSVQRSRKDIDKYEKSYNKGRLTIKKNWDKREKELKRDAVKNSQNNKLVVISNSIDLELLIYIIILVFFITLLIICMVG